MALVTGSIPVVKEGDGIVVSILRQCVVVSRDWRLNKPNRQKATADANQ